MASPGPASPVGPPRPAVAPGAIPPSDREGTPLAAFLLPGRGCRVLPPAGGALSLLALSAAVPSDPRVFF